MQGDGPADFSAFVAAGSGRLLRSAVLICAGDPHQGEELLQASLVRAYAAWSRIESDDPERYVRRVMVNLATDWWRSPLRRIRPHAFLPERPSGEDLEADVAARDELRRALAGLSSRERSVLVLRFFWDLTEHQVAQELGWPLGTVKSTTARALSKVRAVLTIPSADRGLT